MIPMQTYTTRLATLGLLLVLSACGGAERDSDDKPAAASTPAALDAVKPTGKVIAIAMYSNEKGNYYEPKDVEAHRGDLLRFILKTGVHNVNFLADSNPGAAGLPKPSDFLQLPGQEYDLLVSLKPGKYVFQCDPHAALGMFGKLEVEDEDEDDKRKR
jgi:plastocyanin